MYDGMERGSRIESAKEFVQEFDLYCFLHPPRRKKRAVKRPGQTKCTNRPDQEELRYIYLTEGKTAKEIAEKYDVSVPTVRRWLKIYGIRREKK